MPAINCNKSWGCSVSGPEGCTFNVEWNVYTHCPCCGRGMTVRYPITPDEAARIETAMDDKKEGGDA